MARHVRGDERTAVNCQPKEDGVRKATNRTIERVEEVVQGSCRLPCLTGGQFVADGAAPSVPQFKEVPMAPHNRGLTRAHGHVKACVTALVARHAILNARG